MLAQHANRYYNICRRILYAIHQLRSNFGKIKLDKKNKKNKKYLNTKKHIYN